MFDTNKIPLIIGGIEEERLVQRMVNGDQTAFELLFRYYYPGLVVFASNIVVNKDEAEEIVQDFFVRLWENRSTIKVGGTIKSYLFTSVKNRSINYLKSNQVKQHVVDELKKQMETEMRYNPDIYVDTELQQRLKIAFEKLPPRTAEIFTLSRFKGFTNDEIANDLGLSKRTVETQVSNALKILRKELKAYITLLLFF
ncbi:MAG TPA: RNA polymerase sigma-70 factor [Draconibacterium sp.]|nr:RNA polymerase sigma-70 factor [Draconibacterium sp.]